VNSIRNAGSALLAFAVLAACSPEASVPAGDTATPAASATKGAGLTVSNARLVLPPVSGNPAVVYFDLSYSGAASVSLTSVAIEGAGMTMIHNTAGQDGTMQMVMADAVPLTEGKPVSFAPGGLHVMAMEPSGVLKAGGTAKITLTLSDGTTTTFGAPVRAAGDER
jgi:copper(I)-binding protein